MMRPRHAMLPVCLLAVGALACGGPLGPRDVARPGILEFHGESRDVVSAPDTVTAGEPFDVTVRTYGGGCDQKGETRVDRSAGVVVITPIDVFTEGSGVVCPAVLRRFEHAVRVTFEEPGAGEVRVRGRRVPPDEEIVRVRTVVVEAASGTVR